jgi:hypothetical protein
VREYKFETISSQVRDLINLFDTQNNELIVQKMKEIIPEFVSTNSVFCALDQKKDLSKTKEPEKHWSA